MTGIVAEPFGISTVRMIVLVVVTIELSVVVFVVKLVVSFVVDRVAVVGVTVFSFGVEGTGTGTVLVTKLDKLSIKLWR